MFLGSQLFSFSILEWLPTRPCTSRGQNRRLSCERCAAESHMLQPVGPWIGRQGRESRGNPAGQEKMLASRVASRSNCLSPKLCACPATVSIDVRRPTPTPGSREYLSSEDEHHGEGKPLGLETVETGTRRLVDSCRRAPMVSPWSTGVAEMPCGSSTALLPILVVSPGTHNRSTDLPLFEREIVEIGHAVSFRPEADLARLGESRILHLEKLLAIEGHAEDVATELHAQLAPRS